LNGTYRAVVRDELYVGGVLVESRLSHGEAEQRGNEIVASDRLRDRQLLELCDEEIELARAIARSIDARVRIVVRAASDAPLESIVTIASHGLSIATTRAHAVEDFHKHVIPSVARDLGGRAARGKNLIWRNGSAAVLLHEAVGHAAEHGHEPVRWPGWLTVNAPLTLRRESFRDVPLPRMTNVVVEHRDAPFDEPADAIEILLVAGGAYEPLTESVRVDVAVAQRGGTRLRPFSIHASRQVVAQSIVGAAGDPVRYPGVICSREGQELFVGSWAPVIVTAGLH
jgi:hypothetical protein